MKRPKRNGIMLASPATEKNVLKLGNNCFAQTKLNGERARVQWFYGEPILLSSYGNEFKFLNHIKEVVKRNFSFNQECLDGEIYVHGWSRERIHSACSRKVKNDNPDTPKLEFHVFDYIKDVSQWERMHYLVGAKELKRFNWPLVYVPYKIISTAPQDWMSLTNEYIQQGYEGAIFRSPLYNYEKKRSKGLLKFKPNKTDTYKILTLNEAFSQEGKPKNMVGSFSVSGDDGTIFNVGAGKLNHEERVKAWRDKASIIGMNLLVKHETLKTANGIPLCAVGVKVI